MIQDLIPQEKTEKPLDLSLLGTVEASLAALQGTSLQAFKAVERMAQGEPVSLADIFGDGRGLNVYGELYPDLPQFHQPLDQDTAHALLRRYLSTARSLKQAATRVERFQETFAKKMQRRVKALARLQKGFSSLRRQYLQTIRAEDLEPFQAEGETRSSLIFSRKAELTLTYRQEWEGALDGTADIPTLLNRMVNGILDHTEAFRMASGGRVQRVLRLSLATPEGTYSYEAFQGKLRYHYSPAQTHPTPILQLQLEYKLEIPKNRLDQALDVLEAFSTPVFRPEFEAYLQQLFPNALEVEF